MASSTLGAVVRVKVLRIPISGSVLGHLILHTVYACQFAERRFRSMARGAY